MDGGCSGECVVRVRDKPLSTTTTNTQHYMQTSTSATLRPQTILVQLLSPRGRANSSINPSHQPTNYQLPTCRSSTAAAVSAYSSSSALRASMLSSRPRAASASASRGSDSGVNLSTSPTCVTGVVICYGLEGTKAATVMLVLLVQGSEGGRGGGSQHTRDTCKRWQERQPPLLTLLILML